MSRIEIPKLSLVMLVGASGCGKSTFARRHFLPTEILSSDFCRGLVSDDETSQEATGDAFDLLYYWLGKRLERGLLSVVDATNVQPEDRKRLYAIAAEYHVLTVAIVFHIDPDLCQERNRDRPDRQFGPHVVANQARALRRSLRGLPREGARYVHVLKSPAEVDEVEITRTPSWTDRSHVLGPFDIVGDVHGCYDELVELLERLGWQFREGRWCPPEGRTLVLLGDLVDRGPNSVGVLELAMAAVAEGVATCVPGNHDVKLVKWLKGRNVQVSHGLAETIAQIEKLPLERREEIAGFLDKLISHYVLDEGKLVVAHAGMKAEMQGRSSGRVRDFALYGETTGESDEFGLPVRLNWAAEYRGKAHVVYGHTPVPEANWLNRTINIDTGCVFGGKLTALRYPEMELVSVPARRVYAEPARPFLGESPNLTEQQELDETLDIEDVSGKRIIETRLYGTVMLREENAIAALEAMSRFAANPKWLVYLPPTMSPCETHESLADELLEHPDEALAYYRKNGVAQVVCEEKHMGSRAVVVVCRSEEVARRRFGVATAESGAILTRSGRRFFDDSDIENRLLARLQSAFSAAGTWKDLGTEWAVLDCELMPWSAKAQELLRRQYAPVGSAGKAAVASASQVILEALDRLPGDETLTGLSHRFAGRSEMLDRYIDAYRRYCWTVHSIEDLRLAPFHLLATEGAVHTDKDHSWHMSQLAEICEHEPILLKTEHRLVELDDPGSAASAVEWWEHLTASGGEGMVVKPLEFIARGPKGAVQPAVKCRGKEYLRIIYGPEYTLPENLERLRRRSLGMKRSLAIREFVLGIEALERFVRREPLRRVHECVFAVLAMETEPVDPRL